MAPTGSGEQWSCPVLFLGNGQERLLPGWTEALTLMPAGSRWQIVLPPELAFGDSGAGPMIGPGTTVVFEMELVSIG